MTSQKPLTLFLIVLLMLSLITLAYANFTKEPVVEDSITPVAYSNEDNIDYVIKIEYIEDSKRHETVRKGRF